jgi:hypothetical protein
MAISSKTEAYVSPGFSAAQAGTVSGRQKTEPDEITAPAAAPN